MIGVEMVEDSNSRKPINANSFGDIWERCKDMGVLLGKGGLHGNVSKTIFTNLLRKKKTFFILTKLNLIFSHFYFRSLRNRQKPHALEPKNES